MSGWPRFSIRTLHFKRGEQFGLESIFQKRVRYLQAGFQVDICQFLIGSEHHLVNIILKTFESGVIDQAQDK